MTSRARVGAAVETALRLGLLLVMIIVTTTHWLDKILATGRETAIMQDGLCQMATGVMGEPLPASRELYARCMEGHSYVLGSHYALTAAATAGLVLVALAIYLALPRWRRRRGRLTVIGVSPLARELAGLLKDAGLDGRRVRFALDPYNRRTGANVFGRTGDYTVCLYGGLLHVRGKDPDAFRSVIAHELNHIANRDVDLVYLLVALWRSFLAVICAPILLIVAGSVFRPQTFELIAGSRLTTLADLGMTVVIVSWMRGDILRARELHADHLPASPNAAVARWLSPQAPAWWKAWSTHPGHHERMHAAGDSSALFRLTATPFFGAGVVAVLASNVVPGSLDPDTVYWTLTVLVFAVAGVLIVRAVTRAPRPRSEGLKAGVWLGSGIVVGETLSFPYGDSTWLPHHPWILVIPLVIAVVVCGWIAQLAELSRSLPGRVWPQAVRWLGLAVSICAFGTLLVYYLEVRGNALTSGSPLTDYMEVLVGDQWLPAPSGMLYWYPLSTLLQLRPFPLVAAGLLWILAAVAVWRSAAGPVRLRALALGSVFTALLGVAVTRYVRATYPIEHLNGFTYHAYLGWMEAAVILSALLVAAGVALWFPRPSAPVAVVAGGVSMLFGFAALYALMIADGCTGFLRVVTKGCAVMIPEGHALVTDILSIIGGHVLAFGIPVICAGTVLTTAFHRKPGTPPAPRTSRVWLPLVGLTAAVVAIASVGYGCSAIDFEEPEPGSGSYETTGRTQARVYAWGQAGGLDLIRDLNAEVMAALDIGIDTLEIPFIDDKTPAGEIAGIYRQNTAVTNAAYKACKSLAARADRAQRFIPIPDQRAQADWQRALAKFDAIGRSCDGWRDSPPDLVSNLVTEASAAGESLRPTIARLMEADG